MVEYNENIIRQYAETLYQKAESLGFWYKLRYAIKYGIIFMLVFMFFSIPFKSFSDIDFNILPLFIGGVFGLISGTILGYKRGKRLGEIEAFKYKLDAQTALCHIQIELNTRK